MSGSLVDDGTLDETEGTVHVLYVDDDVQLAQLIASDIEEIADDIVVIVAESAHEGMEILQTRDSVDCIVSDYHMPGTDGIEWLRQIRQERPKLPFLLVTGQCNDDVRSRAFKAGATGYLTKTVDSNQARQLVTRIRAAVTQ